MIVSPFCTYAHVSQFFSMSSSVFQNAMSVHLDSHVSFSSQYMQQYAHLLSSGIDGSIRHLIILLHLPFYKSHRCGLYTISNMVWLGIRQLHSNLFSAVLVWLCLSKILSKFVPFHLLSSPFIRAMNLSCFFPDRCICFHSKVCAVYSRSLFCHLIRFCRCSSLCIRDFRSIWLRIAICPCVMLFVMLF